MSNEGFQSMMRLVNEAAERYPDCRVTSCKCRNKSREEWRRGCMCLCHAGTMVTMFDDDWDTSRMSQYSNATDEERKEMGGVMSDRHLITEIHSWTVKASRRWFARCDLCSARRLVADYFEGYLPDGHGWLWVCSGCLVDEISERAWQARYAMGALREIRDEQGKVCENYELCHHVSCQSSYTAWVIADRILNPHVYTAQGEPFLPESGEEIPDSRYRAVERRTS